MTRANLSIQFVLILATVIGIHGQGTPREATLAVLSNFEDGLSDREFRVEYPGIDGIEFATIKISRVGDLDTDKLRVEYTIDKEAEKAKTLYFELTQEEAPAGSYQVQVCLPSGLCSAKRAALGELLDEEAKPALSCAKGESPFERSSEEKKTQIKIHGGLSYLKPTECADLPESSYAFSKLGITSNPAYTKLNNKHAFYAAVWYDGSSLRELFETIKDEGYCSRKYVFWASAHIVDTKSKVVKRRFRGTIIVSEALANRFILPTEAPPFAVEFARYDDEELPSGTYDVSVSFCATDKDLINSSICSKAIHTTLTF